MIYMYDQKKLFADADDSLIIIHNENKFFSWLCEKLKPEYARYLEHFEGGYKDSDDEQSWLKLGKTEWEYLEDLMERSAECGSTDFELHRCDTKSGLPEVYGFSVDYHLCKSSTDLPDDFEAENAESGIEFHYWENGRAIDEPENSDDYGNTVEVFVL